MDDEMYAARTLPYQLAAYERLEMLPHEDQTFESIFNSTGIGKGSGRIEPLIFFPMGIVRHRQYASARAPCYQAGRP